jgi:hypothetical protein
VRGLAGHQAARFTRAGAGFATGGTIGVASSTIALMKIIGNQNSIGMTCTPHSRLNNVELLLPVPAAGPTPLDSQENMLLMEPERTRLLAGS